jgi:hypothetical protein
MKHRLKSKILVRVGRQFLSSPHSIVPSAKIKFFKAASVIPVLWLCSVRVSLQTYSLVSLPIALCSFFGT